MMWGWDGAGWGLMMTALMVVFWVGVIWLIVALVRSGAKTWSDRGSREAEQVLATRYASGEIDEDEYRRRLEVLRRAHREVK